MHIGIIAALRAEVRAGKALEQHHGREHFALRLAGQGREGAARAAHELIRGGCDALVSWGVAGGLSPDVRCGDIVIGARCMNEDGRVLDFDDALAATLRERIARPPDGTDHTVRDGVVLTVAEPVGPAREKQHLHQRFEADLIDMESSAIAYVARSAGKPFVFIRAIVDAADFSVPPAALHGVDNEGRMKPFAVVQALVAEPRQLGTLIELAQNFRRALHGLGAVARALTR